MPTISAMLRPAVLALALAAPLSALSPVAGPALAQDAATEATISANGNGVTYVNLLKPNEGVTLEELSAQLTLAVEEDASRMPGFRTASVHVARDGAYVLNYAQWDSTTSVDAVVAAIGEGQLPELAKAFSMASPEFHPYDVVSVTPAAE